jgi:hypothetical protein
MSGESSHPVPPLSSSFRGTKRSSEEKQSKFGTVVLALWPVKPGLNLAQRVGCTERHANLLITGKRKPNAKAALAVYAEIISG